MARAAAAGFSYDGVVIYVEPLKRGPFRKGLAVLEDFFCLHAASRLKDGGAGALTDVNSIQVTHGNNRKTNTETNASHAAVLSQLFTWEGPAYRVAADPIRVMLYLNLSMGNLVGSMNRLLKSPK